MKKVGEGQLDISVPEFNNKDLQILSSSFNTMISKVNVLMKIIVEKESERINAQFKAFQAQINPHFLFNTLQVVRTIAMDNNVKSIADIAKSLAKMFRYSINRDNEIVTIGEEIEHVRNYISIQKYRYGEKFDVEYDLDDDVCKYKIIKFIIQPLIENAIYHGIETKRGRGHLRITARKHENTVIVKVIDDGIGIPEDKVNNINRAFQGFEYKEEKQEHGSIGIGITNVDSRIKLYYGKNYGLKIESSENSGTMVQITIPVAC